MRIGKRVYIVRYGAFGDVIHCSHVPRLLKEKLGVEFIAFETNIKGEQILRHNPFIDKLVNIEVSRPPLSMMPMSFLHRRWEIEQEANKCDSLLILQNSIEREYIAMEDQKEYYMSSEHRRKKYGGRNYYDQTLYFMGLERFSGEVGELHFSDDERGIVDSLWDRCYKDKFVFICNLSGTSKHKLFHNSESIVKEFLSRHKDTICILMGDESANRLLSFDGERIVNRSGVFEHEGQKMSYPFRQSLLMASKAQMIVGCESGLMVGATLLGTPAVQLMTAASIKNHGGDFANDHSLQSPCRCSPCHKGPYDYIGCPKVDILGEDYPECIVFDGVKILDKMEGIYADHKR